MKKKLFCIALLGCLGLNATGCSCSGEVEDFNEQVDKLNSIISEGELFDKDYQIKGDFYSNINDEEMSIKYHFERDYNNRWIKMEGSHKKEDIELEAWVGEDNGDYYAFYKDEERKEYISIDSQDVDDSLNNITNSFFLFDANLENLYKSMSSQIKEYLKICDTKGISCDVKKSLFGKTTLVIEPEKEDQENESIFRYEISLKNGKIKEIYIMTENKTAKSETKLKFSYFNQIVRLPDTDDFKKID